jgi:hypothetical protein
LGKVILAPFKLLGKVATGLLGAVLGGAKPKGKSASSANRLSKTLQPEDFRKIVFGETAGGVDLRFWEVHGAKKDLYSEVIAVASHRIEGFTDLYLEEEKVLLDGAGAATGKYAGVLWRSLALGTPGQAAMTVGDGAYWDSTCKFTGVASYALKWKVSEKKLPQGVPSRYTQVVKGALVYDPRRDSTRGGSGTHRADDQTTWQYAPLDSNGVPIGRNNALQVLWYLLGWRIANPSTGEQVLVAGRGVSPDDIDFAAFIAAANDAEALEYYTDCLLSTGDDHSNNEGVLTADGLLGELLDPGGRWVYRVTKDDTADVAVSLGEDDVLPGEVAWHPFTEMSEQYNEVAGTFIDPTSLYQERAYPMVYDPAYYAEDGFKKRKTQNFQAVQSADLAQRLGRLLLNRNRYGGEFRATFSLEALRARAWDVVELTIDRYGFDNKLFRVLDQQITPAGIEMVLREEDPSIYAGGTVSPHIPPSALVKYDPSVGIELDDLVVAASTRQSGDSVIDGLLVSWADPPGNVRRTEVQFKLQTEEVWQSSSTTQADAVELFVGPLLPTALYDVRARHISVFEVPGPWTYAGDTTGNATRVTSGHVVMSDGSILEDVILDPTDGMAARLAQLDADVAAAEATVAAVQTQVDTDISALQTDMTDLQSDMTAFQTSVTSDITAMETEIAGINPSATPNLLENGGFENGLTGWTQDGGVWTANNGPKFGWHVFAPAANGTYTLEKLVPVGAVGSTYTLAADIRNLATGGSAYLIIEWRNSSGTLLSTTQGALVPSGTEFSTADTNRKLYKATGNVPTNATQATVKVVFSGMTGVTSSTLAVRRIKFELGDKATAFTSEASAYTAYQTGVSNTGSIATINSTVSTLNSTVSTQGTSISTLTSGLATLTNKVNASSSPNLVRNGGFENGLSGWVANGQVTGNWFQQVWSWGYYARNTTPWTSAAPNSYAVLDGEAFGAGAGLTYTLSGEVDIVTSNTANTFAYLQLKCLNSSGGVISYVSGPGVSNNDLHFTADGSQRIKLTGQVVTPAGTATVVPRLVIQAALSGITISDMNWRQVKMELGSIATPYSGEASASQMYSAYSTLNSSFASLSTTVGTQGSSISTLQSSMTTAQGNIASLENRLVAGNPNLITNGSAEQGLTDWTSGFGTWSTVGVAGNLWGSYFYVNSAGSSGDKWYYLQHSAVPIAANTWYTFTCDVDLYASTGSSYAYVELVFLNSSGGVLSQPGSPTPIWANRSFAVDGANRKQIKLTAAAPTNTTQVIARVVCYTANGTNLNAFAFRQAKLEVGEVLTAYSGEASLTQSFTVVSGLNSTVSTLSSTVSTQGASISTLQSSMSTAQGDVATLKTKVTTGSGNLLANSSFARAADEWGNWLPYSGFFPGRDRDGDSWRPLGEHVLGIQQNNATQGQLADYYTVINVEANKWYEFSARVATHRCNVELGISWRNSADAEIGTAWSGASDPPDGGPYIANYGHLWVKGQAPSGTVRGVFFVRKYSTFSGQGDSYMWFCRPMVREVTSDFVGPSAYVPSGDRASIEVIQTSVNGVLAKYGVTLDVNGYMTGFQQLNNGSTGSFIINADYFSIVKPGGGASLTWSSGALRVNDGT